MGTKVSLDFLSSRIIFFLATIIIGAVVSGCASDAHISATSKFLKSNNAPRIAQQYHIGVDDRVLVNVWRNPELSVEVPVRPDGKISMPLIGDVVAAGYSPEEVAAHIEKRLQNYIRDPNVAVLITGLQSHEYLTRVRVTGAVNNSVSLNYRQGMTVLDAILAAGGLNDYAAPNHTKLYRILGGKTRIISIYLGDILNKGQLETNIELRPRDIIAVPERIF